MKRNYKTIGSAPYEGLLKILCNAVKDGDREAVEDAAAILASRVTEKTVLVPVPGRKGYADYTFELAQQIEREVLEKDAHKDVRVFNSLICDEHESLCEVKRAGGDADDVPLNIRFRGLEEENRFNDVYFREGYRVLLVDNIVDTGKTARACMDILGDCDALCLCDTGNDKERASASDRLAASSGGTPVYVHMQNAERDNVRLPNFCAVERLHGIPDVGDTFFTSAYAQSAVIGKILRRPEYVWKWSRFIADRGTPRARLSFQENIYVCDRWWNGDDGSVHLVMNDRKDDDCKALATGVSVDEYRTLLRNFRKGNMWL